MKKILITLLVFISVQSFGQSYRTYAIRLNANNTTDTFRVKEFTDSVFNMQGAFVQFTVEHFNGMFEPVLPNQFERFAQTADKVYRNFSYRAMLIDTFSNATKLDVRKVRDSVQANVNNKSTYYFGIDAGANDSYVITASPIPASYTTGMKVTFRANTANTTGCTINVNGLGVVNIVKRVSTTLATGDILALMFCDLVYNGTAFVILNPVVN